MDAYEHDAEGGEYAMTADASKLLIAATLGQRQFELPSRALGRLLRAPRLCAGTGEMARTGLAFGESLDGRVGLEDPRADLATASR